ncbi:collagen-like triple helix repeat-containing protein [Rossellomorea sp. AcN35-11]|nr:collagen-like triple helix repeat-containing protein [Rossellomorea aquimaris]WJV29753.1 collagen-like triple helix repeat-containing protein [Rossellomorea sp. AcN35-11]
MFYYDCCSSGGTYSGGVRGRQGAQGIPGPPGPQGEQGPSGQSVTSTSSYAANASGTVIDVEVAGTNIPLPDYQSLPASSITVDSTNTSFTIGETGRYRLAYKIKVDSPVSAGSRLTQNGSEIPPSVIAPAAPVESFQSECIYPISAGETISLQLFGTTLSGLVLDSEEITYLTIMRIE